MLQAIWFTPPMKKRPWRRRYDYNRVMASVWIRCLQLLPHLEREGVRSALNRVHPAARVALFVRDHGPAHQEMARTLRRRGLKIVVDTPVNFFSRQDLAPFGGGARDHFLAMAELADLITCPTAYIAEAGRSAGFATLQLEDAVDPAHFSPRQTPPPGPAVLSWSGVAAKAGVLERIGPALAAHAARLEIIADARPALNLPFDFHRWRFERFPQDIRRATLGVFPRDMDDEYNLGHSFHKIGVYLACRVPVVCTLLPSYAQVANATNSLIVEGCDPEAWTTAIGEGLANPRRFTFADNPIAAYTPARLARRLADAVKALVQG